MLEVLYRIYEVPSEEEKERNRELDNSFGFYSSTSKAENNELLMDCILCETRDEFKEIIKKINVLDTRLNTTDSNVIKLVANDSIYGLRLNNLESEVFRLKKRIEELEKIA